VVNDTIADMLTRVRNANLARHQIVQVPATKMTKSITHVLQQEGFIQNVEEVGESLARQLLISLKYKGKTRDPENKQTGIASIRAHKRIASCLRWFRNCYYLNLSGSYD
jgi:ribosomal protein S8